jgi:hypothetical protein
MIQESKSNDSKTHAEQQSLRFRYGTLLDAFTRVLQSVSSDRVLLVLRPETTTGREDKTTHLLGL